MRVVMMTEMSWQVNEEVSRDMTGEADADGMNQGIEIWSTGYEDGRWKLHYGSGGLWFDPC